jgi:GTP-binding protein HflX
VPVVTVFNKIDALEDQTMARTLVSDWPGSVAISAKLGTGIPDLLDAVVKASQGSRSMVKALVPYDQNALVEACYKFGRVIKKDYRDDGIYLEAELVPEMQAKLAQYAVP